MKIRESISVCLLLFLAVGVRFWMIAQAPNAFCFSTEHMSADQGVILLMGKHIAELGEFPIFYYGQDWFGSIEAFVHALFFLLFGINHWTIHFAPLFFFAGFCAALFLLARDLFNARVGYWALLWCVFSPIRFSEYSLMPHGGYIDAPMLGTLFLWVTLRAIRAKTIRSKFFLHVSMGLIAGLGWWTSPLMIYYLMAAAFFVLIKGRWTGILLGLSTSLPFFFLGASPFFYFYALDPHSEVLSMGGGFGFSYMARGLYLFFFERIHYFLDLHLFQAIHPVFLWFGVGLYGFSTLFFFWKSRKDALFLLYPPHWKKISDASIISSLFFVVVFVLSGSAHIERNSPQYLFPLTAFFPIVIGYWAVSFRRIRFLVPIMCAMLFLIQGWVSLRWIQNEAPKSEARAQMYLDLVQFLEGKGLNRVYVTSDPGSEILNVYSREKIISSRTMTERYTPYLEMLEKERKIAFCMPNSSLLQDTLRVIGGKCLRENFGPFQVSYDFQEPQTQYRQISCEKIKVRTSIKKSSSKNMLDRNAETIWNSVKPKSENMWIEFDLGTEYTLGMIRLWNQGQDHGNYGLTMSIETSTDGVKWFDCTGKMAADFYYWSGPRIYAWEWGYRSEIRFGPVRARYVRITQYEKSDRSPWVVNEAYVYEDINTRTLGYLGEDEILRRVEELNLEYVYADRWMSAKVREMSARKIHTIEPFTFPIVGYYPRLNSRWVRWGPKTGFVVENSDANEFEEEMGKSEISLMRESYGRWDLFYFKTWGEKENLLKYFSGSWMGLGMVEGNGKQRSEYFKGIADRFKIEGRFDDAERNYRRALKDYSRNQSARRALIELLRMQGKDGQVEIHEKILKHQTCPKKTCEIGFEKEIRFLGYTAGTEEVRAGQKIKMIYYWSFQENPGKEVGVFVHINKGDRLIQGDHLLSIRYSNFWPALEGEIFSQEEYITIPKDAPEGEYEIGLGLFDLKTGKRFKVKNTLLKNQDQKVIIGNLKVIRE